MDNEKIGKFIEFLKENNALAGFTRGLLTKGYTFNNNPIFRAYRPEYWIDYSIWWEGTSEGRVYWSELDDVWRDTIRNT